jgi:hypothetical protein
MEPVNGMFGKAIVLLHFVIDSFVLEYIQDLIHFKRNICDELLLVFELYFGELIGFIIIKF